MNRLLIIFLLLIATPVNAGVTRIYPTVDTATTDWSPSSGSDNYAMVDDDPHDSDSTYNSSTTLNHVDLFMGSHSIPDGATINSVIVYVVARFVDPIVRTPTIEVRVTHDAAYSSSASNLTASYAVYSYDVTGLETWQAADFGTSDGNIQFGYDLSAIGGTSQYVTSCYMEVAYTAVYDTEIHSAEIHSAEIH